MYCLPASFPFQRFALHWELCCPWLITSALINSFGVYGEPCLHTGAHAAQIPFCCVVCIALQLKNNQSYPLFFPHL